MSSRPIADEIADVFNHVHQSHSEDAPNGVVLADVAERIALILQERGYCTYDGFADIASMSGLSLVGARELSGS